MRAMKRIALLLALAGCVPGGEDPAQGGLGVESGPQGPRIVFNPLTLPVADVPFPNDLSLTPSGLNASGTAWNLAEDQPSAHRTDLRKRLNQLDGFGPYAPIFVSFEGPLLLDTVNEQSIWLINIEPGNPREGEVVPLDLGQGYFPITNPNGSYWGQDPNSDLPDLTMGRDNLADVDGDGVLERVEHYEVATHTLIIRPIIPLAQGARHAVLLTRELLGQNEDGSVGSIRSPFPQKVHAAQAPFIRRALELAHLPPERLAFGWTYTTADVVGPMLAVREGLYGRGKLAKIADAAPARIKTIHDNGIPHDTLDTEMPDDPTDTRAILQAEYMGRLLGLVGSLSPGLGLGKVSFKHADYVVFGTIESPNLRTGPRQEFTVNPFTGEGAVGKEEVPFMLTVPKITDRFKPPFPVLFYFHGTGSSRMESLVVSDAMARQGWATLAFDEVGHGPLVPDIRQLVRDNDSSIRPLLGALPGLLAQFLAPDRVEEFRQYHLLNADGTVNEDELDRFYDELIGIGLFAELAVYGRNEDINGDGRLDTAEGFFFSDPFRQCAAFLQDEVDLLQMVKMIRGFRQADVPPALTNPRDLPWEALQPNLLAGDFNADGILDIGGPDVAMGTAGTSLGGFHAVIAGAIEPAITTATPIVAGGGFVDIMLRSSLDDIAGRMLVEVFGTLVVACPDPEQGKLWLTFSNEARRCNLDEARKLAFGNLPLPAPGTAVRLHNLNNDLVTEGEVNEAGGFSLAVESDKHDRIEVRVGTEVFEGLSPVDGAGYQRNTPDFRKVVAVLQHVFDRCDPANFVGAMTLDPPPGHPTTNLLMLNAVGDSTVPFSTNVDLALAGGLMGRTRAEWQPRARALLKTGVMTNGHYDIDDLAGDNTPDEPPLGPFPTLKTDTGESGIRFYGVRGKHEFIAFYEQDGFNYGFHAQNQLAIFHGCGGRWIHDTDPWCLQDPECADLDTMLDQPECQPK